MTFGGRVCWQEEPRAVGLDPDTRELLGFERDGLIRDANGACIPLTEHHEPPVAAVLRVLEVAFDEYTPKTKTNVTQNVSGIVGVQVVKAMTGPPAIPPAPVPPPQLEILPDPDDAVALAELLGDEPDDIDGGNGDDPVDEPEPEPEMVAAPEPGPIMIQTAPPPEYVAGPNPLIQPRDGRRPLSDLERDLLSRLPSALNRKA
ncbi:hypothetical protein [Bradyrhizobium erythrophlei]|uniref:hypothetical protein n=1 Tax=Bradyrhizobium erythrophlei TaxID=1437360 RepID=UPI0012AB8A14|nr:hypothetical protein [Bradyrhizobium erythrophlei]